MFQKKVYIEPKSQIFQFLIGICQVCTLFERLCGRD